MSPPSTSPQSTSPKQRAAQAAVQYVRDGMIVGLGTGSTADFFLVALADAIASRRLRNIRGLPTSMQSEQRARELGIPLAEFWQVKRADVTIDGADEVDSRLNLIKGLGGALLREKIVAQNSDKLVIIADAGKRVSRLGTHAALPVEVAAFGHETHESFLTSLGCRTALRKRTDGAPLVTDNHNLIYDCRFDGIDDPASLEARLKQRAGVIETGLFLGMASVALIGTDIGVETLEQQQEAAGNQ